LDVHKDIITACILDVRGRDEAEVIHEEFTSMRGDLFRLRDWLASHDCKNVAMESTGVFWKPVYDILEEVEGMNQCLTNAHHMRNVPGRKDDQNDAEWAGTLYLCGLLNKSFVPERGIRDLREYTRFYVKLTQSRVRIVNRIEKLLQTHGFKLSSVLSSIVGVSSLRILEKLSVNGEVSISDVASSLHWSVKRTAEEIAYAINGKLPKTSQLLLKHMLVGLYSYDEQLKNVHDAMMGVAQPYMPYIKLLATIPGIDILSGAYIIAEIGVDMSRFLKGSASLANWAGLSPRDDKSAGKIKSKKILKGNSHIKSILCQCAWAATKTRDTRPSNWYWRNTKRLGEKTAIIALARKLLVYVYNIIANEEPYNNQLDIADTERVKAHKLESAKQQVSALEGKASGSRAIGESEGEMGATAGKNPDGKGRGDEKGRARPQPLATGSFGTDVPHASSNPDAQATALLDSINAQLAAPKKRGKPKKTPSSG